MTCIPFCKIKIIFLDFIMVLCRLLILNIVLKEERKLHSQNNSIPKYFQSKMRGHPEPLGIPGPNRATSKKKKKKKKLGHGGHILLN